MARQLVLVVCSSEQRRQAWQEAARRVGYWVVAVPTLKRALMMLGKVRPALVFTDVELVDGCAPALVRSIRRAPLLEQVRVVVLGDVTADEAQVLARDPYVYVPEAGSIGGVLKTLVAG